jgi:hypothetical protein
MARRALRFSVAVSSIVLSFRLVIKDSLCIGRPADRPYGILKQDHSTHAGFRRERIRLCDPR